MNCTRMSSKELKVYLLGLAFHFWFYFLNFLVGKLVPRVQCRAGYEATRAYIAGGARDFNFPEGGGSLRCDGNSVVRLAACAWNIILQSRMTSPMHDHSTFYKFLSRLTKWGGSLTVYRSHVFNSKISYTSFSKKYPILTSHKEIIKIYIMFFIFHHFNCDFFPIKKKKRKWF